MNVRLEMEDALRDVLTPQGVFRAVAIQAFASRAMEPTVKVKIFTNP